MKEQFRDLHNNKIFNNLGNLYVNILIAIFVLNVFYNISGEKHEELLNKWQILIFKPKHLIQMK